MAHALPASPGDRRRNRLIVTALVAAVIVALAVGGLVISNHRHHSTATPPTSSSTGTPSIASTTSPTPSAPATAPTTTTTATTTATTATTTGATKIKTTTPATTVAPRTPAVAKVDLVVANNTGRDGLAATARSRFEAAGWTVTRVGNVSGGFLSSCAFYDPGNAANLVAAQALRAEFPAIKRVEPRFSRLPVAPIVVVLAGDYS